MKKFILLALIVLMMIGRDNNGTPLGYNYVELDSCEYITSLNQFGHKGNCRFCKERDSIKWEKRKKEIIEELIIKLKDN